MNNIKKVLVIGSGPVVIGQASEYDYSGLQACRALKEANIEVVLISSNPATITTDKGVADSVYIEPLNIDAVKRIIALEKPDSILPTMCGDTGLEIGLELASSGFLEDNDIRLLGVDADIIYNVQNRQSFKDFLEEINENGIASEVVSSVEDALDFAKECGYPVFIRPAYTMGLKTTEICNDDTELVRIAENALELSSVHQILIEKCVSGWKEIEYEVMRDCNGNCICVSNMENLDPVGIHTGDSIIVIPAQTLTDAETALLRSSALNIVNSLGVQGSCNIQFALKPDGSEYAVMDVDPRVSRSSSLVSKATGYPIAKVATKVAIGYCLDEIVNDITNSITACNEPAIDYCAVKIPKWSFDSFSDANRKLGTSMTATGEVLSIGTSFELAFMKAIRSLGIGLETPNLSNINEFTDEALVKIIQDSDDLRIFAVYSAVKRGIPFDNIYEITKIDPWFLAKLKNISDMESQLQNELDIDLYYRAKNMGFLDSTIIEISKQPLPIKAYSGFKMVDTCAAEFDAQKPYFYSSWDDDNEALMFNNASKSNKHKILILGAGPASVGQGIDLDYCAVHTAKVLSNCGYETILANNNPQAVSTDYETADKLYLEPLTPEDISNIIAIEKPFGAVVQFAGKAASDISKTIKETGVPIYGTDDTLLEITDHKIKINALLKQIGIPHNACKIVTNTQEALEAAKSFGYPVILKNGKKETIEYNSTGLKALCDNVDFQAGNEILLEQHLVGTGIELDIISDGEACFIPAISEHIERSGINYGDSISVYPAITISDNYQKQAEEYSKKLAIALSIKGMLNITFVLFNNKLYLTQVNAHSARNIPFLTKALGISIVELAARCMLGEKLVDLGYFEGLYAPKSPIVAVRIPVFSFDKLSGADIQLGLGMKSTGEVMGIASNFEDALLKGLVASGMRIKHSGGVFITVNDYDKQEVIEIADKFSALDFNLYATAGTANLLNNNCVPTNFVRKIHEGTPNTIDLLNGNKIVYVISTSTKGQQAIQDDVKIRRLAVERHIPTFTSLDTANALVGCLAKKRAVNEIESINLNKI